MLRVINAPEKDLKSASLKMHFSLDTPGMSLLLSIELKIRRFHPYFFAASDNEFMTSCSEEPDEFKVKTANVGDFERNIF